MPGGDRTGPVGAGPMTGRGLGHCRGGGAGYGYPGRGMGFGRGFGRGWRHWSAGYEPAYGPYRPTREQELADLKAQAEQYGNAVKGINERIAELETEKDN